MTTHKQTDRHRPDLVPTIVPGGSPGRPRRRRSPFSLGRASALPGVEFQGEQVTLRRKHEERFDAQSTIEEGGSGLVLRATDRDLLRQVAVKRLRSDRQDPGDVARFVREIQLLAALDHPNIVPLYDVGQSDDELYAVMKWADGETLEEVLWRLRDGEPEAHARWDFEARTRLFLEICRAVAFANERGILHRDIKPGNIIVAQDGSVQLIDWGLAKDVKVSEIPAPDRDAEDLEAWKTQVGSLLGTPAYMSPEQARGETYDQRSEVFALGALFWEMLTLRPLWFEDLTAEQMVEFAKTRDLPVPFHMRPHPVQGPVPAHLSWFTHKAVRPDPALRFESVEAMIDDLKQRAAGIFPAQCPATLQRRTLMLAIRFLDRHPYLFPTFVVSSVLLVVLVAFLGGLLVAT